LKKKADPPGGATSWDQQQILGEFEFIFETALGWGSVGWGTCFYFKNQRQNSSWHCPFKDGRQTPKSRDILKALN
jgi:hypothetical protein